MSDGRVLRLSEKRPTIWSIYANLKYQLLSMILITMAFSAVIASIISKKMVDPINKIDLENPIEDESFPELFPLVDRIRKQNEEIERHIEKLESDVSRKTMEADFRKEFTTNVSHELKTPLTSIMGSAEIIKEGIAEDEDVKNFASRIYDESARLSSLVNDILTISRLDDERPMYNVGELDLYEEAKSVKLSFEQAAQAKNIKLDLAGEDTLVNGAGSVIHDMIYNLTYNAVRYSKNGGKVRIEVGSEENHPYIRVRDNGIGISKDEQERIFERFYMVDKTRSKDLGGTGLALQL